MLLFLIVALFIVAGVLAVVRIAETKSQDLLAWAVLAASVAGFLFSASQIPGR